MTKLCLRGFACLLVLLALGACQSATLIDLNKEFVALSQQESEAESLYESGVLDTATFDSVIDSYRTGFAQLGARAVESADMADTPQNRVSFLNAAVRSYLKAGSLGDERALVLAEQGIEECSSEELQGLSALPVTCGYFHIATAQLVNNEQVRNLTLISRKAAEARSQNDFLPAEYGVALKSQFDHFVDQIDRLKDTRSKIDWSNTDSNFETVFNRQLLLFYCNADDARILMKDVERSGTGWDREQTIREAKAKLDESNYRSVLDDQSKVETCDEL